MTNDFLKFLKDSKEGSLKVYLGMAAGEAKRLRAEGIAPRGGPASSSCSPTSAPAR